VGKRTRRSSKRSAARRLAATIAVLLCLMLLSTACSSTSEHATTSGAGSTSAVADAPSQGVSTAPVSYASTAGTPPSAGPAAVRGKTVWIVSCAQTTDCAIIAGTVQKAGRTLGWHTKVCDGALDTDNAYVKCIDQAIAAKADGIITIAIDCGPIKSALAAAKAANIPVVNTQGFDCNQSIPVAGPAMFTADVIPSTTYPTQTAYESAIGRLEADWLIAQTHGNAKVISMDFNGNTGGVIADRAFDATIATCSGCQVYNVPVALQQVDPTDITSLFQAAALKYPQANSVQAFTAALFFLGLAQRVKESSRHFLSITSGTGATTMDLIRQDGGLSASVASDFVWIGYASADTLNRVFAGSPPVPEGLGLQIVDATHNLPATGAYQVSDVNYAAAYDKMWSGS
jgi:ribose transport system substrate-binding protein